MKLPLTPEQLPAVDQLVLDAVLVEHNKSTTAMAKTLRGMDWSPMQVAYIEDKWSWSWIAKAVVAARMARGLIPVDPALVAAQIGETGGAKVRAAEASWDAEHGPTRPPAAPGVQIHLPPKPATTPDASAYLLAEPEPGSQGERL